MSPLIIVIIVVCAAVLLVCAFMLAFAAYAQHKGFGGRFEKNPLLKYFTPEEFNLKTIPVATKCHNVQLKGFIYYKGDLVSAKKLIILSHGMGPGQCAYTTGIAFFCNNGCAVLAFDCAGSGLSGGRSLGGLENSTRALVAAYRFAVSTPMLCNLKICFVGHSMGAYSALCATKFVHPQCVVAFSSPERPSLMVERGAAEVTGAAFAKFLRPFVKVLSFFRFGSYADLSASCCIARSGVPALVFHGDRDRDVPLPLSAYARLCSSAEKGSAIPVYCAGKAHNPYNTIAAEKLLRELKEGLARSDKMSEEERKEFFSSRDYTKICEEDSVVMNQVLTFIMSN